MDSKLYSLSILVGLLGLSWTSAGQIDNNGADKVDNIAVKEWKELKEIIFKPSALEPEETLKQLKRLFEILPQLEPLMGESDVDAWKFWKEEIIGAADISFDKCKPHDLFNLENTIAIYGRGKSMKKLLYHLKGQQYAACKTKFDKEFKEILEGLQREQKDDVVQLTNEVLKYDGKYGEPNNMRPKITFNGLTRGCIDILKQRNPKLSKKTPKEKFIQLFESSILESCEIVASKLRDPIEFYNELLNSDEDEIDRSIDQETFSWLIREEICKRLTEDRKYHFDVAYETIRHKSSNKRLIDPRILEQIRKDKEEAKQRARRGKHYSGKSSNIEEDEEDEQEERRKSFSFWSTIFPGLCS